MHVYDFQTFLSPCTLLLDPARLLLMRKLSSLHVYSILYTVQYTNLVCISTLQNPKNFRIVPKFGAFLMGKFIKVLICLEIHNYLYLLQVFTLHVSNSQGKTLILTFITSCTFIRSYLNVYPACLLDTHVY